jgi:hypothetical protein
MIRICVCGGRDFNDKQLVYETLDKFLKIRQDIIIVNGDARGADSLATEWAKERNVKCELFPANWEKHKRAAGPIRNKEMIDSKLDVLVAFPGGKGTQNMIAQCKKNNVKVFEIK